MIILQMIDPSTRDTFNQWERRAHSRAPLKTSATPQFTQVPRHATTAPRPGDSPLVANPPSP
jgi:hypothetical protein